MPIAQKEEIIVVKIAKIVAEKLNHIVKLTETITVIVLQLTEG